ncbi:MAG: hypothetical protein K2G06_02380, partial [Muribaculaceae bacterium]|nr:hypothetical protein [Muribaculaceae bacterium]
MGVWIVVFITVIILNAIKIPKSSRYSSGNKAESPRRRELRMRKSARRARAKNQIKTLPWFDSKRVHKNKKSYWDCRPPETPGNHRGWC